jgi:hypothetical protein
MTRSKQTISFSQQGIFSHNILNIYHFYVCCEDNFLFPHLWKHRALRCSVSANLRAKIRCDSITVFEFQSSDRVIERGEKLQKSSHIDIKGFYIHTFDFFSVSISLCLI